MATQRPAVLVRFEAPEESLMENKRAVIMTSKINSVPTLQEALASPPQFPRFIGDSQTLAYVITLNGKFLRKKSGRAGFLWVDSAAEATLYPSEKALDQHLLRVARENCQDDGPWPEALECIVTISRRIDHSERLKKNRERTRKAEATSREKWDKIRRDEAQREVRRLEEQLEEAKKRIQ